MSSPNALAGSDRHTWDVKLLDPQTTYEGVLLEGLIPLTQRSSEPFSFLSPPWNLAGLEEKRWKAVLPFFAGRGIVAVSMCRWIRRGSFAWQAW